MAWTGLIFLFVAGLIWAQTPRVDLSAVRLRANANLIPFNPPGPPLIESLGRTGGRGLDFIRVDESDVGLGNADVSQFYRRLACESDLIAVGHSNVSASHLSTFGTTVYTDYDFVVDGLLKDNLTAPVANMSEIVVTRLGGALTLPEGRASLTSQDYPLLQAGTSYLMFLSYLPVSGSYRAVNALSTLTLVNGEWRVVRKASAVLNVRETSVKDWVGSCAWNR